MRWPFKRKISVLSPLEGYNRWAASYHEESNPIKQLSDELVAKMLPLLNGKSFFDAGCGTGKFCQMANVNQAKQIFGCDLSAAMIDQAKKNCPTGEFVCTDLTKLQLENKFDVINCSLVLAHIENLPPVLEKLIQSLNPSGILLVTDFHPFLTLHHSKRTFKDSGSGRNFEIKHYLHLFQEYFDICRKTEAMVEMLEEPCYRETPVIFGLRIRKLPA